MSKELTLKNIKDLSEVSKFLSECSLDYTCHEYMPIHELNFTYNDFQELERLQNKFIVAFEQAVRYHFKNSI